MKLVADIRRSIVYTKELRSAYIKLSIGMTRKFTGVTFHKTVSVEKKIYRTVDESSSTSSSTLEKL